MQWAPMSATSDSISYHDNVPRALSRIRVGDALPMRAIVWPTPLSVVSVNDTMTTFVTEPVSLRRIPSTELRCLSPAQSIRYRVTLTPRRGGEGMITAFPETQGGKGCLLSVIGRDRLQDIVLDAYLAVYRRASLDPASSILP